MWKWQHTYDTFLESVQDLTTNDLNLAQSAAATVRATWTANGKTKLTQHRTLMQAFRKRLKQDLPADHVGLIALNLSTEEWTESARSTTQFTPDLNEHQQILSPDAVNAILTKATQLLSDDYWRNVASALALLTGRRMSEIMKTASFEKSSEFSLWFTGTVERGGKIAPHCYEIPCLCAANDTVNALNWLRQEMPTHDLSIPQCNQFSGELNLACETLLDDLIPPPIGQNRLNLHCIRGVYTAIAAYFYCPPDVDETEFRSHIMGNILTHQEQAQQKYRGLTSDRFFLSYAISEDNGTWPKGVRLNWPHVQILGEFQAGFTSTPSSKPKFQKSRKRYTVGFWESDRSRVNEILEAIAPDHTPKRSTPKADRLALLLDWIEDQLDASAPQPSSDILLRLTQPSDGQRLDDILDTIVPDTNPHIPTPQADRLACLFDWIEEKLDATDNRPTTATDMTQILIQQTETSGMLSQMVQQQGETSATLRNDVACLTQQMSQQPAHPEMLERVHQLEQETQHLTLERNQLLSKLARIYQTLGLKLPNEGSIQHSEDLASPHQPLPPMENQNHAPAQEQPQHHTQLPRPNHAGITGPEPSTLSTMNNGAPQPQSYHSSTDGLDPDIVRAIHTVMHYNDHTAQSHAQKWAIAVNPLQQLLSTIGKGTNTKIMKAIKQLKEDIEQHHYHHGLSQRHNKCHQGQSITHFIQL